MLDRKGTGQPGVLQDHGERQKGQGGQGEVRAMGGVEGRHALSRSTGVVRQVLQHHRVHVPQGTRGSLCHDGLPYSLVQGLYAAGLLLCFLHHESEGLLL